MNPPASNPFCDAYIAELLVDIRIDRLGMADLIAELREFDLESSLRDGDAL